MRGLILGAAAIICLAANAQAAPFTVSAVGTVVATDGTLVDSGGGGGVPFRY
jgi:hypothetical protein